MSPCVAPRPPHRPPAGRSLTAPASPRTVVLTYRCFSFINALNGGSSPVRLAFAIVVTAISLGSYATGVLSIATYFSFRDYAAIDLASRTGSHMFDISQGSWLGSSLLVDVMLSAAISQELFKTLVRPSRAPAGCLPLRRRPPR